MSDVIMLSGFQGSGKSFFSRELPNIILISNDVTGDKKKSLKQLDENLLAGTGQQIILDNTHLTRESRREFIEVCRKYSKPIKLILFEASIEECQIRVLHRQYKKYQTLFFDGKILEGKDPGVFSIATLFSARKQFERPALEEGFSKMEVIRVPKMDFSIYPNRAVFFDIDGTLRKTEHLPNKYPTRPEEVELLSGKKEMMEIIGKYRSQGYLFCGVSNQSGISKGVLTEEECIRCMERVKELLELPELEIKFCPHRSAQISCYCRKPQSGLGMYFIEKYKIDPAKSIMVGDMTMDRTFAERLGMQFYNVENFFTSFKFLK